MSKDADDTVPGAGPETESGKNSKPDLPPAAPRALEEARARQTQLAPPLPCEVNGRGGLDPVRYGDWEVKGLASDF